MKIVGLTYDLKSDYQFQQNDPADMNAEFDRPDTINALSRAIEQQGFQVKRIGNVHNLLKELDHLNVDLVFNIAEGIRGRNRESQVPMLLEMAGIPFVGSDALTMALTLDKIIAKKIFIAEGIPTPRFFEAPDKDSIPHNHGLTFPLMVKPRFEGCSKGLSAASRVDTVEELRNQIEHVTTQYKQSALVEEFIRGEEVTIAIVGNEPPQVLPPVQIEIDGQLNLQDNFYTFGHITSSRLEYICPAKISREQTERLSDLALRAYRAVECLDFCRMDFRIDQKGNPFLLEINAIPALSTLDVFMITAQTLGISYEEMIGNILKPALKRYGIQ